jgi:putative transposase
MLTATLEISERRACKIVGQHRSTQRREPLIASHDAVLRHKLREFSRKRPRWGYRRAHASLLEDGYYVNRKRVQRLWREEGLRVPAKSRKRRRVGDSTIPAKRLCAEHKDHVWALDYQFDQTADGRKIKVLSVVDEFTREALTMKCDRRIDADATVTALQSIVTSNGRAPTYIRCDNGPELTSYALKDWCLLSQAQTSYIDPGAPWQNPYVESFHSRVRDELLNIELFQTITEAKILIEDWRNDYNNNRYHSSLAMMTPARFAATCEQNSKINNQQPEPSLEVDS